MNLMFPTEYPLSHTHPLSPHSLLAHPFKAGYVTPPTPSVTASEAEMTPKVVVENSTIHLRVYPAEIYLTADSINGLLNMHAIYDGNVYEAGVIREWLDELREAALWYLGQTRQTHRDRQPH